MIKSFWGNNIRSFFLVVDFLCQIVKACKLIVKWANIQKIDKFLTPLKMMMCVQKQLSPRTKANRVRRGQTAFFSRGASSPVLLGNVGRESRSGFMFILDMVNQHCWWTVVGNALILLNWLLQLYKLSLRGCTISVWKLKVRPEMFWMFCVFELSHPVKTSCNIWGHRRCLAMFENRTPGAEECPPREQRPDRWGMVANCNSCWSLNL